jgi:hypothetical protein
VLGIGIWGFIEVVLGEGDILIRGRFWVLWEFFSLLFFRRKEAKESRLRKFAWFLQQKIERKPSRAHAQGLRPDF